MKKNLFLTFLVLALKTNFVYSQIDVTWDWRWDIRSVPALGFFPLGGSKFDNISLSTFIGGPSVDLLCEDRGNNRFALLNFSAYLVGLNYAALQPQSEASVFQIGYARIDPHYRWAGNTQNGRFAIGGQFGYGALLEGNTAQARSKIQHGLEISLTFSWTPFDD